MATNSQFVVVPAGFLSVVFFDSHSSSLLLWNPLKAKRGRFLSISRSSAAPMAVSLGTVRCAPGMARLAPYGRRFLIAPNPGVSLCRRGSSPFRLLHSRASLGEFSPPLLLLRLARCLPVASRSKLGSRFWSRCGVVSPRSRAARS